MRGSQARDMTLVGEGSGILISWLLNKSVPNVVTKNKQTKIHFNLFIITIIFLRFI